MNTSYCVFWPDLPNRCDTIRAVLIVFTILSVLGCALIVFSIAVFKQFCFLVQRLILALAVTAGLKSIFFLFLPDSIGHGFCIAQGFFIQFLSWAELLWVLAISVHILLISKSQKKTEWMKEVYYHIFVWMSSIFFSAVPFLTVSYGDAGFWCWIDRESPFTRFGTWYLPSFIILILIILIYCYLIYHAHYSLKKKSFNASEFEEKSERKSLQEEVKPLLAYPIIYIFLTLPLTICRVEDAVYPDDNPSYVLLVLSVITIPLSGLFNAIAFSCFQETLKSLSCHYICSVFWLCTRRAEGARVIHNYRVSDVEASQRLILNNEDDDVANNEDTPVFENESYQNVYT